MPEPINVQKSGGLGVISQGYLEGMTFVGKVKGYSLYIESEPDHEYDGDKPSDVYVVLVDLSDKRFKRLVSHAWLSHAKNGYFTIDMVQVSKHYSGMGISYAMYKAILKKTNIKLVCGDIQSPGGRYIWRKLIQSKDIIVKAGELKNYSRKYEVKLSRRTEVYAVVKGYMIDIYSEDFSSFRLFAEA